MSDCHPNLRQAVTLAVIVAAMTLGGALHPSGAVAATDTPPAVSLAAVGTVTRVADRAVDIALAQRGVPYVWGGNTPNGFDCSGLVQWAYRQAGIRLPRTSRDQAKVGVPVSLSQIRRGDLLFYAYSGKIAHVAIAVGDGQVVEASRPGRPVGTRRLYTARLADIRRVG